MLFNQIRSSLKRGYNNLRFHLSARNNPLFIGYYKYLYKPEPGSLEEFIDLYSRDKSGSFTVVQIGANDGINHDPIHKFIKRDNWQGLLVEPQPQVFKRLEAVYSRNPGIKAVNAAIAPENGIGTIYRIAFSNARWANGLTSFNKETLVNSFNNGMIDRKAQKEGLKVPERWEDRIAEDKVRLVTAYTLLKEGGIDSIDLLQIDTEGYDYEILKMFEIEKTKPQAIIFETIHFSLETLAASLDLLTRNNYKVKTYGANSLALGPALVNKYRHFTN